MHIQECLNSSIAQIYMTAELAGTAANDIGPKWLKSMENGLEMVKCKSLVALPVLY